MTYLRNESFLTTIRVFHGMERGKLTGPVHKHLRDNMNFCLYMGVDAANVTTDGALSILPAVLFLQNLPLSIQHRLVI